MVSFLAVHPLALLPAAPAWTSVCRGWFHSPVPILRRGTDTDSPGHGSRHEPQPRLTGRRQNFISLSLHSSRYTHHPHKLGVDRPRSSHAPTTCATLSLPLIERPFQNQELHKRSTADDKKKQIRRSRPAPRRRQGKQARSGGGGVPANTSPPSPRSGNAWGLGGGRVSGRGTYCK